MYLQVRVAPAQSSAGVQSSSAPAAPAGIRRVPALRQVLPASRRADGPCIPHAPLRRALRVAVQALVSVRGAAVRASVPVREALLVRAAAWSRLRAKRRVPNVRAVRHAAVDVSSTRRPKKAR